MIVEPAMMNCGVIFPEPGYLQGIKDLMHEAGAYLAFDEVKTGITLAYGGAAEVFGVTPDILCLAKAIGGGLPCGAIGATRELYQPVVDGVYDMAGTYNGNPLTMAASRVALTEVMTPDVYAHLNAIHATLRGRVHGGDRGDGSAGLRDGRRREGLGHLQRDAGPRVPRQPADRRARDVPRVARAAEPGRVQVAVVEAGDLDDGHHAHGGGRPRATSRTSRSSRRC